MRSRDGNKASLLAVCSIIFFLSSALQAAEYLVSYRYVIKDMILYNDSFLISPAMKKCNGTPQRSLDLILKGEDNLMQLVSNNNEAFRKFIEKIGLEIDHKEKTTNFQNSSSTIITMKTSCFKVDFNDNFAKISHLK